MSMEHQLGSGKKWLTLSQLDQVKPESLKADPLRHLRPLAFHLKELHAAGKTHGALTPEDVRFDAAGVLDVDHLKSTASPLGKAPVAREHLLQLQQKDAMDWATWLYRAMTGHAPPVGDDGGNLSRSIFDEPGSAGYDARLREVVESVLARGPDAPCPSFETLCGSLPPPIILAEPVSAPFLNAKVKPVSPPALPVQRHPNATSRLPNGTVSRPIRVDLPALLTLDTGSPVKDVTLNPEGFPGLTYDGTFVEGSPSEAGEFEVVVSYRFADHGSGQPLLKRWLTFTVNPNPQSLWKNLASDQTDPFAKPDTASFAETAAPFPLLAASVRGRSHAHVGSFRDDDFAVTFWPETGWYALTVADGAGSAKLSRRGSQIACKVVCEVLTGQLSSPETDPLTGPATKWMEDTESAPAPAQVRNPFYNLLGNAALRARVALEEEASREGATLRDYHTTLISVLARPFASGWLVASFSIGDGVAGLVGAPEGTIPLLTKPDGGEFAGQTTFLTVKDVLATSDSVFARLNCVRVPSFTALLVMTDGVSDPKFHAEAEFEDPAAWQTLWDEIQPAVIEDSRAVTGTAPALEKWLEFWSPGNHDDRTLAVLAPHIPTA